jgi:hypothetical protein
MWRKALALLKAILKGCPTKDIMRLYSYERKLYKLGRRSYFLNFQVVMDFDTTDHALCRRAGSEVRGESPFRFLGFALRHLQVVCDSNLGDSKDMVYVLNIPFYVRPVTIFRGRDLLFGQEPGQCTHHSGSGRSDDVVKRGSMFFLRFNFIETLDPTVNAVINGLIKSLDRGPPGGALLPHNFDP